MIFTAPALLWFLLLLPVLWWLLRLTPPAPRKVIFPALSLLRGLAKEEQTPARTPWWLLLLRLGIAALLILACAGPLLDPQPVALSPHNILIAVDNDWASARAWDLRQKTLQELIHKAGRNGDTVTLLALAPSENGDALQLLGPLAAKAATADIEHIKPQPWPSDWAQAKKIIDTQKSKIDMIYWLSSDIGNSDARALYQSFHEQGTVHVFGDSATPLYVLQAPRNENDTVALPVMRAQTDKESVLSIAAKGSNGQILAHLSVSFAAGAPQANAQLDIPLDIRNQIARFEVEGVSAAATTVLLDGSWEKRPVGLVGDKAELDQHSLLSSLFYIDRALKPFADIRVGSVEDLLKQEVSILILPDSELSKDEIDDVKDWLRKGGVLVRFAGERLAAGIKPEESVLLPVALRSGDRSMGGALSWATPQHLQAFAVSTPFYGIETPPDVTINRQVLAEPSGDLAAHVWASLADGTPLVTARNIGKGASILFHVPARSDWSNLPLSGLFVDMLRRILDLSKSGIGNRDATSFGSLPPFHMLDAFGEETKTGAAAQPLSEENFSHLAAGPAHPPGLYGNENFSRAFNLGDFIGQPEAWKEIPIEDYAQKEKELNLQPYLFAAAFLLFLVDFIISLFLRGLLKLPRKWVFSLFIAAILLSAPAQAAGDPVELTSKTYLAYILTGDRQTDTFSAAGLATIARVLERRTSLDEVGTVGVDPDSEDLAFYPFLYWPVVPGERPLSEDGVKRVNNYLHHGGMIVFDAMTGENPSPALLQQVTANLDIPPLVKLPDNHVLKRSFYLLDDFPGRYANPDFWVEPENLSNYDGVATVLLGSNGWAAAWAMDDAGRPLFPCTPGGEQQRERAIRFGVNLTMYALTGNYKSDQLHAQELLKRIGK